MAAIQFWWSSGPSVTEAVWSKASLPLRKVRKKIGITNLPTTGDSALLLTFHVTGTIGGSYTTEDEFCWRSWGCLREIWRRLGRIWTDLVEIRIKHFHKVSAGYLFAGNLLVRLNLKKFWWIPVKGVTDTVFLTFHTLSNHLSASRSQLVELGEDSNLVQVLNLPPKTGGR